MSGRSASPNCISHLSIGTNDSPRARAFYDAVMAALGYKVILEYPGTVAYSKLCPEFQMQAPIGSHPASVGNGSHADFFADSKARVNAFHAAALAVGTDDEGAPDPCPLYSELYYGCFVRDLGGHRVEISYRGMG